MTRKGGEIWADMTAAMQIVSGYIRAADMLKAHDGMVVLSGLCDEMRDALREAIDAAGLERTP